MDTNSMQPSSNVWIVRHNKAIVHICSTKEKADVMAKYLNDNAGKSLVVVGNLPPFSVKEYYTDAYITKLKNDYSVYQVFMNKAGDGRVQKTGMAPNAFGWSSRAITRTYEGDLMSGARPLMVAMFTCTVVAKSEDQAMKLGDEQRIKTLLDDRWTEVEKECHEYNKPHPQNQFDWTLQK